jgi:hypothetical protein
MNSSDPIGILKVSGAAKRKTIEFINDEYRAKHELQKEKAFENAAKKRKHKDDDTDDLNAEKK